MTEPIPRRIFEGTRLEDIGNVQPNYKNPRRWVKPEGLVLVKSPALALKLYRMLKPTEPRHVDGLAGEARQFIETETRKGRLDPFLGMGFAILSEDMLNIARWDSTYPIVPVNNLYSYENGDISTLRELDIREVGAFCLWEDKIKAHEGRAWVEYLNSRRGNGAKRRYLMDLMEEGDLSRR